MADQRFDIIGVKISETTMACAKDYLLNYFDSARNNYICVSNVHTTVTARENTFYREVQNNSFLTLPDGKPLSIIGKKRGLNIERVTGPDFMESIFEDERFINYNHFFYGNTKENLDIFIKHIKSNYPDLKVCGYEESVFRDMNDDEKENLKKRIIYSKADFVWAALGAPKQEIFCSEMCKGSNAVWIGVGGAFNVVAGIIPRAPKWMQNLSLEWMYRLTREPKRLFKRYLLSNTKFIWYLFLSYIRGKNER